MKIIKSLNTKQIIIYMNILFRAKGRLGNALFRYLGCTIFSLKYNLPYVTQPVNIIHKNDISGNITDYIFKLPWDDMLFDQFIEFDKKGEYPPLPNSIHIEFVGFYQHDTIYKKYKNEILEYIRINKEKHYVITDGVNAGDGNKEKFYLKDIIDTPFNFSKFYDFVLHIRLGDKVDYGITLSIEAIKNFIKTIEIPSNSCIVVNTPKNEYENNFLDEIVEYIHSTKKVKIKIESNSIITDFHIMKNAKTLACSVSTISWCAAYFSKRIKKCYMPDYTKEINPFGKCKKPIDNTELYDYN